jgi:hypothetical protein
MPPNPRLQRFLKFFSMEWGLLLGILCASFGFILFTPPFMDWKNAGFQELSYSLNLRRIIPASTLIVLGIQLLFSSFFLRVLVLKNDTE